MELKGLMEPGGHSYRIDGHSTVMPGLVVRRTASLPLAYARPSTSFLP
jgi:hypothetical protein